MKDLKGVVIQLEDVNIRAFIIQLQIILNKKPLRMLPHITLRGPYKSPAPYEILDQMQKEITKPILIEGIGYFDNSGEIVVYFCVKDEQVEKFWWKRDFPKYKYGINPHITIYKGNDKQFGERIVKHFKEIDIRLQCNNFSISWHDLGRGQSGFFESNEKILEEAIHYKLEKSHQEIIHNTKTFVKNLVI